MSVGKRTQGEENRKMVDPKRLLRRQGVYVFGCFALAATACSSLTMGSAASAASTAQPVKIGLILPLSGVEFVSGNNAEVAAAKARLAVANARGGANGHQLQLIVVDD